MRKEGATFTETILKSETYTPLSEVLSATNIYANDARKMTARRASNVSPLLLALLAHWSLQRDSVAGDDAASQLQDRAEAYARQFGLPAGIVDKDLIASFVADYGVEVSPVAAVLGGILGQEVLNCISQKQIPLQNLLIFNGDATRAPVYCI